MWFLRWWTNERRYSVQKYDKTLSYLSVFSGLALGGLNYSMHCKSQGKHWDQCDLLSCKLSNSPTFIYSTGFAYSEKPESCNSLFAESNGKSTFQQDWYINQRTVYSFETLKTAQESHSKSRLTGILIYGWIKQPMSIFSDLKYWIYATYLRWQSYGFLLALFIHFSADI